MATNDQSPTPPEEATRHTVAAEWWTSAELASYLGYRNTRDVNTWFRRHHDAGHFNQYAEPRREINVNHTAGADPRGNRWKYWAPACVDIHERSVPKSSRLRSPSELE